MIPADLNKTQGRRADCAARLAAAEEVRRVNLFEELFAERMERKCGEVTEVYRSAQNDWNQTLHIMLLRAMGRGRNTAQLERLARVAPSRICLREASSTDRIEALLLGASGLLEGVFYDDYIIALKETFDFLARKYSIEPMKAGEWDRCRTFPSGNPMIRLAQTAALVANAEMRFDNIMRCSSREDLRHTFGVGVSNYWTSHFKADGKAHKLSGRVSDSSIDLIGINLVVPLMYAAAAETHSESLRDRALRLMESIPAEENSKVASWSGKGVKPLNAFDTQALLELSRHCSANDCGGCPLAKQLKINIFTD